MATKKRIAFIDFHRGLAILVMIEVHVFNALLSPEIQNQSWFSIVRFINGLVAPSFLFVSGFAFIIAAEKKTEEFRKYGHVFWNQIGRILLIYFAGYSLHLPFHSLSKILTDSTPEQLKSFFAVDILQTIALGLLILLLIVLFVKKKKCQLYLIIAGALFFILFAPAIWSFDFGTFLPIYLSGYLNTNNGSLFPLFPWLSFMFIGSVFGRIYISLMAKNSLKNFDQLILSLSLFLIVTGHLFLWKDFPIHFQLSVPNYFFFMVRFGYVLLILYISKVVTEKIDFSKSFIMDLSRESLLVYWLHLVLLFGQFWNGKSINQLVNQSFILSEASTATAIFVVLMIVVAIIWGIVKAAKPSYVRNSLLAAISIYLVYFLIS